MSIKIQDWRDENRASLRKLSEDNPVLRMAIEVLENETPVRRAVISQSDVPPEHSFIYAYGRSVGWEQCLATIQKLMSPPPQAPAPIVSEFAEEKDSA